MFVHSTGTYLTPLDGEWQEGMDDVVDGRHMVYSQASVSDDDLMLRRISLHLIDHGSFGVVYDCQLDGHRRLVLKAPRNLLDADVLRFNPMNRCIERGPRVAPSAQEDADNEFGYEFAIGERIVDTPTMRRNYLARTAPGQRIQDMSEADFQQHDRELALRRTHPGVPHILLMVHYCPTIPCIFMSPW